MSVIVSRAIPDVRDGLKPVQRRILYAMNELGFTHDKPYKKSARIVGETMGKYHPHGDAAIYDTLARMAQDFSLRYPLIDGQGNFGSIDGDAPAAMRYTEARLARIAEDMMEDIDKETVPFMLNFDGSLMEPQYLPAKVPNLLINGTSGIAVGMATNMVPHNLREVCDAIIHRVRHHDCSVDDLIEIIKAPDFPGGGGIVFRTRELIEAYRTGKGSVKCQGEVDLSEDRKIIITSLPYGVNKAQFIEDVAEYVRSEVITGGITDIRDESDRRGGMRIVIKIRDEGMRDLILNQLYEHTDLEKSIGIINLVLVDNEPKTLNLLQLVDAYISHRMDVIRKRALFDLRKETEREHILEGLYRALEDIDRVIAGIRSSRDAQDAREFLKKELSLDDGQAQAILDMRLQRLTSLEREKVASDLEEARRRIVELRRISEDEEARRQILVSEMEEIRERYGDERRSMVLEREAGTRSLEDLIPREDDVIVLSENGLLKRVPLQEYRSQRRGGGKGGSTTSVRKEDTVKSMVVCSSHDTILYFTNTGRVLRGGVAYEIEKKNKRSVGTSAGVLLHLAEGGETVTQIMRAPDTNGGFLVLVTRRGGLIKKTEMKGIAEMRSSGIRIITLTEDDEVVAVEHTEADRNIMVVSSSGKAVMFNTSEVRPTGRTSMGGVRAIRLDEKERVIAAFFVEEGQSVLTVTENAIGKRTSIEEFRVSHRGGTSGVNAAKQNERTGRLIKVIPVWDDSEVLIVTRNDKSIRIRVSDIRELSRAASGVKLMSLEEGGDAVTEVSLIDRNEEERSEE